jgi:hypothetical protein
MGVLACDRPGCKNIMCDYVVLGEFYLCGECHGYLAGYMDLLALQSTPPWTREGIVREIRRFMGATASRHARANPDRMVREVFDEVVRER